MNQKVLNKVLKEIKVKLNLDYALNKGFMSPSCTTKMLEKTYGIYAIGIYVRWFGDDQDQLPISQLDKLYINHDFGKDEDKLRQKEIVEILEKYYFVEWDYSDEKTILIKERERKK
jgi:hypothetical protein